MSFGKTIAAYRKKANLSLKELATKVIKEDGQPISPQYLNDIEHDRRNPPSDDLIEQLANALDLPPEYLHYLAGIIPDDLRAINADKEQVVRAFKAFRKEIKH